jgi:TctA family transporter
VELLNNLAFGMAAAATPTNLLYCFLGALFGTLIGVLPGLGPLATIAMLMPLTFHLDPMGGIIMLAGIYYGAQYGGSTTAILVNIPGESSSVVTALDGHQMAKMGRAGAALGIAALGSFFAGTVATMVIAIAAAPMMSLAQQFSAAEYFSLMILGLIAAIVLANGEPLKAVLMVVVGVLLGLAGTDIETGAKRMTFGITELSDGIAVLPLAMGLFAVSEVIRNLLGAEHRELRTSKIGSLLPTRREFAISIMPIIRGTALGSILGVLPGGGAVLSSFASYAVEKRVAKDPSSFGKGAIQGVAGPESANNAGAQTSFIPMLTLGIPTNPVLALMIGAMMIHGIQPGPLIMERQPVIFWGLIASMWIGNLMLVIINLPLIGIWVQLLKVRYVYLFPAVLMLCAIGIYSSSNSSFDVYVAAFFGVVGYVFIKLGFEPAPLILGFILGPQMEENMRRALLFSRGDPMTFLDRPISLLLLSIGVLLLAVLILPSVRRKREEMFVED